MITDAASDIIFVSGLLKTNSCEAFSLLYDKYAAALYGFICRIVQNKNIGGELLQDVFVKVWRNINKYNASKGTLFMWMLQIARNTCIAHLCSYQHTIQLNNNVQVQQPETLAFFSETHYVENNEPGSLVLKLDHRCRQILDLVYYWGYSQKRFPECSIFRWTL